MLTAAVVVLTVLALLAAAAQGGAGTAVRAVVPLALVDLVCCACFWHPRVLVDGAGVHLRNVLRTVDVPWSAIEVVDTRYAFTLETAGGSWSAWAAPAPGRYAAGRTADTELAGLPETSYGAGRSIRPGDTPSSASGAVALVVRRRWEDWQEVDAEGRGPDGARGAPTPVAVRWHRGTLGALAALVVASTGALLLG